ncbi:Anthranilate N-benzoyltransferase protein, putative [Ricinus communis]|uniref:Anthranilate N-benzoyltransferase protein, putative n=1 Tax=Ricinus communis TaxID=3988 RepID=B9T456_RICCO|nr:Anthranilate N-benzoyltransferase protein, putative [Ricinus communis]|eukprot:XP_002533025.1 putrescine hydroxycinnamoyltransferase 3 [Ricinus communis]
MDVRIESIRTVKPIYNGICPLVLPFIPLSVFDKFTYNTDESFCFAYGPPTPPNEIIEYGLKRALSEYREFAGRLGEDEKGDIVILLNDTGLKLVEASVDSRLDQVMPMEPSPVLFSLYPSLNDEKELLQVQLTRFTCGSLVVAITAKHSVVDGHGLVDFLFNWGRASRGLDMSPLPFHDRTIFIPRDPPRFEHEHRGLDFIRKLVKDCPNHENNRSVDDITVHRVNFTLDILSKIKAMASASSNGNSCNNKPYSTCVSLTAHLWRAMTKARGLDGFETTHVIVSVNGRKRMIPGVPNEYFGNVVLWAFPSGRINDILQKPLPYAGKLVHDAIANVNNNYFKSFIDFAAYKAKKEVMSPIMKLSNKSALCPNLEVDSWLQFPYHEIDFGGGSPFLFLPSYFPMEGMIYLLQSLKRDGSVDALVFLYRKNLATFKQIVYSLDHVRSCM